jgi:hypothetical protein
MEDFCDKIEQKRNNSGVEQETSPDVEGNTVIYRENTGA